MAPRLSTGLTPEIKTTILGCLNNAADMAIDEKDVDTSQKRETVKKISAATAYIETLTPASERVAPEEPEASTKPPAIAAVPSRPRGQRRSAGVGSSE